MKRSNFLIVAAIMILGSFSIQQATGQEISEKEDQQKEIRILKEIEEQKKAMYNQQRTDEDVSRAIDEAKIEWSEALEDIEVEVVTSDLPGEGMKIYKKKGPGGYFFGEAVTIPPRPDALYEFSFGDSSERTSWSFSKSIKANSFSRDYEFDVEKTAKSVVMSVSGDCKAGEIRIKIIMPNGKSYSDVVIDEYGSLNWRKSFTISDTENQDKTGEWKYQIESKKATGYFKISLQTY
jgi:hypothetical protein